MKTSTSKTWKKTIGILSAAAILSVSLTSCGGNKHKDDDVESFRVFVTELKVKDDSEVKESWDNIEREYEEKVAEIDQKEDKLEDNIKQEYEQLKQDYKELKAKYDTENMDADVNTANGYNIQPLYETILTNEGDMDLTGVTASNIGSIYKGFVDIVDSHKNEYTREDWDEVDVLWDALNKRKNELEDNLSSEQKLEIGEEKVKYGTYKSLNKLPAKSEEKRSVDK